jgi:phenylacetate-CoA ligase
MDGNLIHLERAFASRQYRWAGLPARGGRIALLRGDMIVPAAQSTPPFWRYDAWNREMWFSSYHISEATAPHYLDGLETFDPHLIFAYPSAIFSLSQFATAADRTPVLPSLQGIVTSSETFFPFEREKVSEVFSAKIFDWYGQFERVIFIGTCEDGRYHLFPDYGIAEFLPVAAGDNGALHHEIVGTGFLNQVMPLIRYRTGDTVELPDRGTPCACGRHFPQVQSIIGRIDDEIRTPDGRRLSVIVMVFKSVAGIRLGQIIQESIDRLTVKVVPGPEFDDTQKEKLIAGIRERTGDGMKIEVQKVSKIEPGSNGKIKTVLSLLKKK